MNAWRGRIPIGRKSKRDRKTSTSKIGKNNSTEARLDHGWKYFPDTKFIVNGIQRSVTNSITAMSSASMPNGTSSMDSRLGDDWKRRARDARLRCKPWKRHGVRSPRKCAAPFLISSKPTMCSNRKQKTSRPRTNLLKSQKEISAPAWELNSMFCRRQPMSHALGQHG